VSERQAALRTEASVAERCLQAQPGPGGHQASRESGPSGSGLPPPRPHALDQLGDGRSAEPAGRSGEVSDLPVACSWQRRRQDATPRCGGPRIRPRQQWSRPATPPPSRCSGGCRRAPDRRWPDQPWRGCRGGHSHHPPHGREHRGLSRCSGERKSTGNSGGERNPIQPRQCSKYSA
jgi:hypothetical protein